MICLESYLPTQAGQFKEITPPSAHDKEQGYLPQGTKRIGSFVVRQGSPKPVLSSSPPRSVAPPFASPPSTQYNLDPASEFGAPPPRPQ